MDLLVSVTRFNSQSFPIYFIDDDPSILKLFEMSLSDKYRLKLTSEPTEFLTFLKEEEPAVVFVDYHLRNGNAKQLIEQIDSNSRTIMISGDSSNAILLEAINENKIVEFVTKPFTMASLVDITEKNYQLYLTQVTESIENSKMKIQATQYQDEIARLNSHLFDSIVSTYTDYKIAEKLALSLDDHIKASIQQLKLLRDADKQDDFVIIYNQIRMLVQNYEHYFGIDHIEIIDRILEFLIAFDLAPGRLKLDDISNYLVERSYDLDSTIANQLIIIADTLQEEYDEDYINSIDILEKIVNLNLVITLTLSYIRMKELPQPSVQYLLIIQDQVSIFKSSRLKIKHENLSLMSNFITALGGFAEEVLLHGQMKAIQLDQGVIVLFNYKDLVFCCLVDYQTHHFWSNFQEFTNRVGSYIYNKKGDNLNLDQDEYILSQMGLILNYPVV